jgi:hypothetical protein
MPVSLHPNCFGLGDGFPRTTGVPEARVNGTDKVGLYVCGGVYVGDGLW